MFDKFLMKLRVRDDLSPREEQLLRSLAGEEKRIGPRKTIIRAGEELDASTLLLEGVMCRYKDLRDGSRQIVGDIDNEAALGEREAELDSACFRPVP